MIRLCPARGAPTLETATWDEQPYDLGDGLLRLTRAGVTEPYQGDVEGSGTTIVMPDSGRGDLPGPRGEGGFVSHHERHASFTLTYERA